MPIRSDLGLLLLLSCWLLPAQPPEVSPNPVAVPLVVSAGVPLRLYITERLPMRQDRAVSAKLIEPVWAFDRIVLPAGAELLGHITRLDPAAKMVRAKAILGGDLTPLHKGRVEFTSVMMPDARRVALHTDASIGLGTIYSPAPPKSKKNRSSGTPPNNTGILGTARQQIGTQIHGQINSKTRGIADLVRGPNKLERLEDFLLMKLPYHPQWYRRGTRFDAVLQDPLDFGQASMQASALRSIGTQPPADSIAMVRLLSTVSSADAQPGAPVAGVLSEPLFSPSGQLLLPEGTRLSGTVKKARPARYFHRTGQLRFTFDKVETARIFDQPARMVPAPEAQLTGVEADPKARVKVDDEGTAKATESKARLIGPVIALLVASRAADNDADRLRTGGRPAEGNYGGRTAGGLSGFGLLGAAAAQSSRTVGAALGYYGLAWSVYSTVISRGPEVEFEKNTAMTIRFGSRTLESPKLKGSPVAHVLP